MNLRHPTAVVLRRHRWRARGTLLVWAMAATAAAAAFLGAEQLHWFAQGAEWALVAIALGLLLLGIWFTRASRLTPAVLARELDRFWALRARLETTVELAPHATEWAAAQRDDTAQQLATRKLPGSLAWLAGHAALVLMGGLVLLEGAALAWRAIPATPPATAAAKITTARPENLRASIVWKSPASEIKASAIEEVPLLALAESNVAFLSVSLELLVNGDRENSQPIDLPTSASAGGGAPVELRASLFLDELQVKEGDLVAYRLVASLSASEQPRLNSPVQFIEIRRTRPEAGSPGGKPSPTLALLFELKGQQLQLIKQNSVLLQHGTAWDDPTWLGENARVAAEQEALGTRTAALIALVESERAPSEITGKLNEAKALMHRASQQIATRENEAALKLQNRALAILVGLVKPAGAAAAHDVGAHDPIPDQQNVIVPPRNETPAGELEQLAGRQGQINQQLATAGASTGLGTSNETGVEQAAIADQAARLAANSAADPATQTAIQVAATAAAEAARHLASGDRSAARVPAATAQQALDQAIAAQEKTGRAGTVAELDALRRTLNEASRLASASERTQILATAGATLRAAAVQQQRFGSAQAAQDLTQLAELAADPKSATNPGSHPSIASNSPEHAQELALAAARAQVNLASRRAALSRTIRMLNRARQPPSGGMTGNSSAADFELASQEAQSLALDQPTIALAQQLARQTDALQRSGNSLPPPSSINAAMGESATQLAAALERARDPDSRDEFVRRFSPADVDPVYRAAVETYFERLSRAGGPASRPAAK